LAKSVLFYGRLIATYPIIIRLLGFLTLLDILATGVILALTKPPTPKIRKVWIFF